MLRRLPQNGAALAELQTLIRGKKDLAIVSISLNDDAPEVLRRYAGDHQADTTQWIFLTGPKHDVHKIVQEIFKQTALVNPEPTPGKEILHSSNLVVVDRRGVMRGYMDGKEPSAGQQLYDRLIQLSGRQIFFTRTAVEPRVFLPRWNAGLNACGALLLALGYLAIRLRKIALHKLCMLAALTTSALFLASYLYYHIAVLEGHATPFTAGGWVRGVYFTVLISHMILAALVAPLALTVAWFGLRNRLDRHVRLARWTLPVWFYVSITGVVVYWMLYQI